MSSQTMARITCEIRTVEIKKALDEENFII
jgi:hypothetical protein